jgi:hypothetical protein
LDPSERLQIEYIRKPVHRWGGLVALVRDFDRLGFRAPLEQALPDRRTSPNQIPAVEIVLACFAAVLTGATRFAHVERLRADAVHRAILGTRNRRPVLRLGLAGRAQAVFTALLGRVAVLSGATMAQLDNWATTHGWSPPAPVAGAEAAQYVPATSATAQLRVSG